MPRTVHPGAQGQRKLGYFFGGETLRTRGTAPVSAAFEASGPASPGDPRGGRGNTYCGWRRSHSAPLNETMVETMTFVGIYRGIMRNQGFFGDAKWISSIHSSDLETQQTSFCKKAMVIPPKCGLGLVCAVYICRIICSVCAKWGCQREHAPRI